MIGIQLYDHVGIRITDELISVKFYEILGFKIIFKSLNDCVIVMKNKDEIEINLIVNGVKTSEKKNILMDNPVKLPGFTHIAFRVNSIKKTLQELKKNNIKITQGPVKFDEGGNVSIFIRDPDLNTIEFRGRNENDSDIKGLKEYESIN